jgi:Fe2+ or Zn2+ uptake regulation protein
MVSADKHAHFHPNLTPQRIAILDYSKADKKHSSTEDIYRAVAKRCPTISLATVNYRLSTLKTCGRMLKLNIGPSKTRYNPSLPFAGNRAPFRKEFQRLDVFRSNALRYD